VTRTAAVFIPWGQADMAQDGQYASQGVAHIGRRNYRLGGVYRSWEELEAACKTLGITVVVFAKESHFDPRCTLAAEFVGEDTRRLIRRVPTRLTYPAGEYRSAGTGETPRSCNSLYETARLLRRGDDGGYAERFLKERSNSRDT
jgi:hypothetical protein